MAELPPDEILIAFYPLVGISSDRIASSAECRRAFCNRLPVPHNKADPEGIARRLVTLRKAGKLPRLTKRVSLA